MNPLEERIGYKFRNSLLLIRAIHRRIGIIDFHRSSQVIQRANQIGISSAVMVEFDKNSLV